MATWFEHRVVAACSLCEMAHMYAICSLFAYAAFYVVDSGWASDRDAAGFVADGAWTRSPWRPGVTLP